MLRAVNWSRQTALAALLLMIVGWSTAASAANAPGWVGRVFPHSYYRSPDGGSGPHSRLPPEYPERWRLELWATPTPFSGSFAGGYQLTAYNLGPLAAGASSLANIQSPVLPFASPPSGMWYVSMVLTEQTGAPANGGYSAANYINFPDKIYGSGPATVRHDAAHGQHRLAHRRQRIRNRDDLGERQRQRRRHPRRFLRQWRAQRQRFRRALPVLRGTQRRLERYRRPLRAVARSTRRGTPPSRYRSYRDGRQRAANRYDAADGRHHLADRRECVRNCGGLGQRQRQRRCCAGRPAGQRRGQGLRHDGALPALMEHDHSRQRLGATESHSLRRGRQLGPIGDRDRQRRQRATSRYDATDLQHHVADRRNVSGTVAVSVNASDNVGVARVDLLVNGVVKASDTTAPYQLSWNTTTFANGSAQLKAIAYDAAGNSGPSAIVTVNVANAPPTDTTPPTASITSPTGGNTSGTVAVSVNASDNVGVARVDLLVKRRGPRPPTRRRPTSSRGTRPLSPTERPN